MCRFPEKRKKPPETLTFIQQYLTECMEPLTDFYAVFTVSLEKIIEFPSWKF